MSSGEAPSTVILWAWDILCGECRLHLPTPAPFGTCGRSQEHKHWLSSRLAFLTVDCLSSLWWLCGFVLRERCKNWYVSLMIVWHLWCVLKRKKRDQHWLWEPRSFLTLFVVKNLQVPKAQVYRTWADKAALATIMNLNKGSANPLSCLWQQPIADVLLTSQSVFSHLLRICRRGTFWATGFSTVDFLAILNRWTTLTFDFFFRVSR